MEPPTAWMVQDFIPSGQAACMFCHFGDTDPATSVLPGRWRGSLHAHAYRDPIFQAAFEVAKADAPNSGELCIRCHTPRGWLEGRATPPTGMTDGSSLLFSDIDEGVTCNVCHRLVDLTYDPANPPADLLILQALSSAGYLPVSIGNAQMVVDPMDVRRGPFTDPAAPHPFAFSPHHRSGDLCGTCHEVSNPMLTRVGGVTPAPTDTYVLNPFNQPHPTQVKTDQFPEQRTYSEWLNSTYASTGVNTLGRFGGNRAVVRSCQDCHMPAQTGIGCLDIFEPPIRTEIPYHSFQGANITALDMLLHLFGPTGTGEFSQLTVSLLQRNRTDVLYMLDRATDAVLSQFAGELNVRIVNECGHKLLTGMPEGRRIWVNVKFFNGPTLLAERGFYDTATATLTETDTKVYEAKLGLDSYMAGQTGKPAGPSFNLVLVNKVFKDNRIPPRGFTNSAYNAAQAGHVAYAYPDGQHWDDSKFCVPAGATRAEVKLFYQTASREYMEFLRDNGGAKGLTAYNAWVATGRSAPVPMDDVVINLAPYALGDVTGDGLTSFADITAVLVGFGLTGGPGLAAGDANCDGMVNFTDLTFVLVNWGDTAF